jgi:hypothetical protein
MAIWIGYLAAASFGKKHEKPAASQIPAKNCREPTELLELAPPYRQGK